jgi:hypothetical protein
LPEQPDPPSQKNAGEISLLGEDVSMPLKECFGQLANMNVTYNNSTKKHFLRIDEVKLKNDCDHCELFTKCMFVKHNEIFKELLRMLDESGVSDSRPKLR